MIRSMRRLLYVLLAFLALGLAFSACDNGAPPNGGYNQWRAGVRTAIEYTIKGRKYY